MKKLIIALALLVSMPVQAEVQLYYSGAELSTLCESESVTENNECRIFLAGIYDANEALHNWGFLGEKLFCVPSAVRTNQLRKIFIKYANDNPQSLHLSAAGLVMNAFAKAFPCEKS